MNKYYPQNISKMFLDSVNKYPDNDALVYKEGHHYESLSYSGLKDLVEIAASAFESRGFEKGDKAIIISENRPEWVITDLAITMIGGIIVPIHEVLSTAQIEEIIEDVNPRFIIVSNEEILDKVKNNKSDFSLISFEDLDKKAIYFEKFISNHKDRKIIEEDAEKIDPDDIASIIYTSGTTGKQKGVKLTHKNFMSNVVNVNKKVPCLASDRFFSILPLSHVFERTAGYYVPLYGGASIGYACDLKKISEELKKRKPTVVIAVPRLFEKIYEKINEKARANPVKALIFSLSKKVNKKSSLYNIFDKLVFEKIRGEFGGEVRFFVSGGAPLPKYIGEFFEKVGLVVLEGYGLTECSPVVAVNKLEEYKFGTVGKVIDDTAIKLSSSGEIMVKGVGVTQGYVEEKYNNEAFHDGWFRTGDIGRIDGDGFLTITDRKKDLIVLSTGKKVAPAHIEATLEKSPYIDQSMVLGEKKKHVGALIVPDFEKLKEEVGEMSKTRMIKSEKARNIIEREIESVSEALAKYDKVYKFRMIPDPFTVENGELTPTLKLKRNIIHENNRKIIDKIY